MRGRSLLQLVRVEDAQTEDRLRVAPGAYSSSGIDQKNLPELLARDILNFVQSLASLARLGNFRIQASRRRQRRAGSRRRKLQTPRRSLRYVFISYRPDPSHDCFTKIRAAGASEDDGPQILIRCNTHKKTHPDISRARRATHPESPPWHPLRCPGLSKAPLESCWVSPYIMLQCYTYRSWQGPAGGTEGRRSSRIGIQALELWLVFTATLLKS